MIIATLLAEGPDPADVSPGVPGFLWTFGVALAFFLLVRSFIKHMRRLNINSRRAELAEQDLAEQRRQAREAEAPTGGDDSAVDEPAQASAQQPSLPEEAAAETGEEAAAETGEDARSAAADRPRD